MCKKLLTIFAFVSLLFSQSIHAQEKTVTGTVTDAEDGMPLPQVNVLVKGTTNGTSTDFDGKFSLKVSGNSAVLVFSAMGYASKEVAVGSSTQLSITLSPSTEQLGEVVVTALGIKREKKSLGYAFQEVKGEAVIEARENNVANAFSGKVAGLQVVRGSNGPASSSKIVLRGNNSLTGDNQPLIVVDGIPMSNFTGAANNDYWNPSPDMGNGLGDLNPDDIESLSVLKGPAAAALYGSRAGNGVILITTKSGKARKGLGITYSNTVGFETIFMTPDMQNSYGQGSDGVFNNQSGGSWGPKIEGQSVEKWDGSMAPLRAYDNIDAYFKTGVNVTQTLSFQQQFEGGTSLYSSITYLDDKSKIPGASLDRLNLLTRAVSKFGSNDKWTTDFKVQYINSNAQNRPLNGVNISNAFATMYMLPRSLDVTDFSAAVDEFGNHIWYVPSNSINPYWNYRYNLNSDSRDRFMLNGSLKYEITDWLNAEVRAGSDLYTTNTESKVYGGSPLTPTGRYGLGKNTFNETNYSYLLTAQKDDIIGKWGGMLTLGGNLMRQKSSSINASSGELEVPNLFSLNNGKANPTVNQGYSERRINSIYGSAQINYDGYWFLDITGRNDWSSALHKDNRSFFYPSVSTSLVFTEMLSKGNVTLPEWITFGKLRASYAEVGNDMSPYQLYNFFNIGKDPNGNTTAGRNGVLFDPYVKSELIRSWELGIDARFFNNRIGFDFSLYKSNATRQLLSLPMNPLSGYNYKIANAGDIENKGFELMVNARVIEKKDFAWDVNLNVSKNINTVNELTDEVTQYGLGGFDNVNILAVSGERYGEIWGTKFARVEDETSAHFGKIIVDGQGIPLAASGSYKLGNQQPDAMLGFSNTFTYKRLSFSFLVDARFGGEIFSGTNMSIQSAGTAAATVINGSREDIIFDGVVSDGSGGYTVNSTGVSPQLYWQGITARSGNLGITEANLYDATNIRIRNVQLNYALPEKWINTLSLQNARIGFSVNNLLMLKSHLNGVDPESVYATGTNAVGFENVSSPTSRTYFLNLSLSF